MNDRPIGPREYALICAMQLIVMETMDFPPLPPDSADSYLPEHLVQNAQQALRAYGINFEPTAAVPA